MLAITIAAKLGDNDYFIESSKSKLDSESNSMILKPL